MEVFYVDIKPEIENELWIKEKRIAYWEKYGVLLSMDELIFSNPLLEEGV